MPSTRRRILRTVPLAAVGIAGCSSLQPNEQGDCRTATSSPETESSLYEPTTPAEDGSGTPAENPEYAVQTPVTIFVRNYREEPQTVRLTLAIEPPSGTPQEALNRTYEVPAGESLSIGAFEQNGRYHFTVETADQRAEETVYISMQQLADCNAVGAGALIDESGISIYSEATTAGCSPATATPEPTDGG